MSVREQQKQATRGRVLDAARDLFDQVGYEETTIRAIAEKAGVSVGSVFTTFASKDEILSQIMAERMDSLGLELERVVPHLRGSALDRLCSLLAIQYEFHMQRPKLFLAFLAISYSGFRGPGFRPLGSNPALGERTREVLQGGVDRGELRPDLDLDTAVRMVVALYAINYLLVPSGAATKTLSEAVDGQLRQLFEGFVARPGVNPAL